MTESRTSLHAQLYAEFEALGLLEDPYNTVPMPVVALPSTHRTGQLWRFVDYRRADVEELPTVRMEAIV